MKKIAVLCTLFLALTFTACSNEKNADSPIQHIVSALPAIGAGSVAQATSVYTDSDGDKAVIPAKFRVSGKAGEQRVRTGLVVIGEDGSEFVWVPVLRDTFASDRFSARGFFDETDSVEFKAMRASAEKYGGFYIGRYEASRGAGDIPQSKRAQASDIWVHIPPLQMIEACKRLYADNAVVTVFLPWGITWDRTLEWLVETGCKTEKEVATDSTSWGNYANNRFKSRDYAATGAHEETRANNFYDLAGNFWEWTQERTAGGGYAARSGGYSIMGGACNGNYYPAAVRSGLSANDHHPNIGFRLAMYINEET